SNAALPGPEIDFRPIPESVTRRVRARRVFYMDEKMSSPAKQQVSLSDQEISSARVTRRSLLGTLGLGAGVAMAAGFATISPAHAADGEGRGRRCRFRDTDRGDTVRVYCGLTDND